MGDVIQLRPKTPRPGGGARSVSFQCPDCSCAFHIAYHHVSIGTRALRDQQGGRTWRIELTCPGCGACMEIPEIGADGGHAS